ncbi:hypothetical protein KR51_00008810 [Rubidibacter lacunae KORDI 51-2]|uniref:Uncharacterized protein n=1 Tax=Rubidibacter lacunae KORDI 51-2 TaxID=582515 RepID=U5DDH3_9CHRO|nr:hypothetical protein KR51_00008810 [Rubidibacter lacunae KORDI 51-2]
MQRLPSAAEFGCEEISRASTPCDGVAVGEQLGVSTSFAGEGSDVGDEEGLAERPFTIAEMLMKCGLALISPFGEQCR